MNIQEAAKVISEETSRCIEVVEDARKATSELNESKRSVDAKLATYEATKRLYSKTPQEVENFHQEVVVLEKNLQALKEKCEKKIAELGTEKAELDKREKEVDEKLESAHARIKDNETIKEDIKQRELKLIEGRKNMKEELKEELLKNLK